jgi:hypothetical protein
METSKELNVIAMLTTDADNAVIRLFVLGF